MLKIVPKKNLKSYRFFFINKRNDKFTVIIVNALNISNKYYAKLKLSIKYESDYVVYP